jgi:hypothetical protein
MSASPLSGTQCRVELQRDDRWCRVVFDLRGPAPSGSWVIDGFRLAVEPADRRAGSYKLSNWMSGLKSGARYACRKLNRPLQKFGLHELTGRLSSEDMTALACAAALAVAALVPPADPASAMPFPEELEGWTCRVETVPQAAAALPAG